MKGFNYKSGIRDRTQVVIGSTGPFTLLCAAALIKHMNWGTGSVSVFDFTNISTTLSECHQWLCRVLGMSYLTSLGNIENSAWDTLGSSRFIRVLRSPHFLSGWRRWGKEHLNQLDPEDVECLILPFRPSLEDVLLANLFPNASIHYVADGFLMGYQSNLKLPRSWRLRGLLNPFENDSCQEIWTLSKLSDALNPFGKPRAIEEKYFSEIVEMVKGHPEFISWIRDIFPEPMPSNYSLLLLQNLSQAKWIDPYEELILYINIIKKELVSSSETIIIKPHPRENTAKVELLKIMIPGQYQERVRFMELNAMSVLPAEILIKCLPISSLVGLCTTSLLIAAELPGIETRVYSGHQLPDKLQKEVSRCAQAGGLTLRKL